MNSFKQVKSAIDSLRKSLNRVSPRPGVLAARTLELSEHGWDDAPVGAPGSPNPIRLHPARVEPPTNVSAEWGSDERGIFIDVSWTGSGRSSEFEVSLKKVEDLGQPTETVKFIERAIIEDEEHEFDGLRSDTDYRIVIRARGGSISRWSDSVEIDVTTGVDDTEPGQVQNFSLSGAVEGVIGRWDAVDDFNVANGRGEYQIEIDTDDNFSNPDVRRVGGTIASFTGLDEETTYYGRVAAVSESGVLGPYSTVDSGVTAVGGRDFELNPILETEIADDAISTPKLQANAVNAGKIIATEAVITETIQIADAIISDAKIIELDAGKVTFGEMSGDRIEANTLDVAKASTGTLEAGEIELTNGGVLRAGTATDGVIFDAYGIRMYDGGDVVVDIPAGGTAEFSGDIFASGIEASSILGSVAVRASWSYPPAGEVVNVGSTGMQVRGVEDLELIGGDPPGTGDDEQARITLTQFNETVSIQGDRTSILTELDVWDDTEIDASLLVGGYHSTRGIWMTTFGAGHGVISFVDGGASSANDIARIRFDEEQITLGQEGTTIYIATLTGGERPITFGNIENDGYLYLRIPA